MKREKKDRQGLERPGLRALPPAQITGAILAGGLSRRLGRDKATLPLGGVPLALRVAVALAPVVGECWLITNQPQTHLALGLPLVTDLRPGLGPLGGLETALFCARTPWVLAAAVDNPFVPPGLLAGLADRAARTSRPAVVCRSPRGLEPFPGLYAVRLLPKLREFLSEERRPQRFLTACRALVLDPEEVSRLDPRGLSFFNLNTPEDLEQAAAWLAGEGGVAEIQPGSQEPD
jgi:molybdopterin-guanine dinucleotide biosynthesis protein A